MNEKQLYNDVIDTIRNWREGNSWQTFIKSQVLNRETEVEKISLDSLDVMEIIVKMEEKYGVKVKDKDIDINTIGDIVETIMKSPQN